MKEDCIFCFGNNLIQPKVIAENDLVTAIWDNYPKAPGHALLIPKAHRDNFFDLTPEEAGALQTLSLAVRKVIDEQHQPEGYNVFSNVGQAAGQVVMHAHVHLVPRSMGDNTHLVLGHESNDKAE